MMLFFVGWAFVLMDVPVTLGNLPLELLPDALGYFLMYRALREDTASVRLRRWMLGMAVFSAGLFLVGLWELSLQQRMVLWALGSVELALCLWLLRRSIPEQCREKTDRLKILWIILLVVHAMVQLLGWLPLVGNVMSVAALVMSVCFLAGLYPVLKAKEKHK